MLNTPQKYLHRFKILSSNQKSLTIFIYLINKLNVTDGVAATLEHVIDQLKSNSDIQSAEVVKDIKVVIL